MPLEKQNIIFTRGPRVDLTLMTYLLMERVLGCIVLRLWCQCWGRFGLISPWKDGKGSNFWFELLDENEGLKKQIELTTNLDKTENDCEQKATNLEIKCDDVGIPHVHDNSNKLEEKCSKYEVDGSINIKSMILDMQESSALNISNFESKDKSSAEFVKINVVGKRICPVILMTLMLIHSVC